MLRSDRGEMRLIGVTSRLDKRRVRAVTGMWSGSDQAQIGPDKAQIRPR